MITVKNENIHAHERVLTMAELEQMDAVKLLELLRLSLPNGMNNESIIIRAAVAAAAGGPGSGPGAGGIVLDRRELLGMFFGVAPDNYHTFEEWKKRGRIVKRGERAVFSARIWKYSERHGRLTAEQAERINTIIANADGSDFAHEGDETANSRFFRKTAYFFGIEQTEELGELGELPTDCERRTENGKEIISGNTTPIKEQLKACGYKWHKRNRHWYKFVA